MAGVCGCCVALKPRYKRLIDNIFPEDAQEGLVKSNMEKLTFYALSSPEKLDRIGEYLAHRLSRDVHRHRVGFVFIAMEALDQLLVACHAHTLNLFVESFLKMVQKLMECEDPDLQIRATASFVKFANIEEDTPSYHRRYDFFVSKFSAMCHSSLPNDATRNRIRSAGLLGIQGVVRKTVLDDLQVNIWESVHMDKIVPSLLYNMHNPSFTSIDLESPRDESDPSYIAETVFRDLVCRASYGNIKSVLRPVLVHMDNHDLWVPNEFVTKCFKIIMYSVQAQYGYLVVQMLMSHLDAHVKSLPSIKAGMVDVLFETVLISAGGSIGPSVLEVFNTLLRHLRISVDTKKSDETHSSMELKFQDSIINTIGQFANNLPDYQKIEIMIFIMGKLPHSLSEHFGASMDVQLQTMLLKTMLKVATKYCPVSMANAFPSELLDPLLRMSIVEDPGIRLIVQDILHQLIDRHDNGRKFNTVTMPKDIASLDLTVEKPSRQDVMFMKKSGRQIYWHLCENMEIEMNRVDNFEALYATMCLICIEMGGDEIIVELVRLALDIQLVAANALLPMTHRCAIHSIVAAFFNLISQMTGIPALIEHVAQVVECRRKEAPHMLPDFAYNRTNRPNSYPIGDAINDQWLFDQGAISEALDSSGHDTSTLATPFTRKPFAHSDTGESSRSVSDIHSINLDVESTDGSPLATRKTFHEEITFDSLKKMLTEDVSAEMKEEQEKKRLEILETFRTAPFEEIVARSEAKSNHFHNKLNEILDQVSRSPDDSNDDEKQPADGIPIFEMQFPDLFVY